MGKASRSKAERRTGRTVRVFNDVTRKFEVFHHVTVSDEAVEDWRRDRWMSVAQGYPNRPPDWDTDDLRGWSARPSDPPMVGTPLARTEDVVAFYRSEPFEATLAVAWPDTSAVAGGVRFRTGPVVAVAKGAVSRDGSRYLAAVRLQAEFTGTLDRQVEEFASEVEARLWVVARLNALSRGRDVQEVDVRVPGLEAAA